MCVLAAWKPLVKRMKETLTGKIINVIKNAMIVDKTKGQFWRKSISFKNTFFKR